MPEWWQVEENVEVMLKIVYEPSFIDKTNSLSVEILNCWCHMYVIYFVTNSNLLRCTCWSVEHTFITLSISILGHLKSQVARNPLNNRSPLILLIVWNICEILNHPKSYSLTRFWIIQYSNKGSSLLDPNRNI